MKYLLDTNICIYLIKNKPAKLIGKIKACSPEDLGISSVTLSELYYGVYKSQFRDKNLAALELFIAPLQVFSFDALAAKHYGELRASLEKTGKMIGSMDMMIAAHAISLKWVCVTNNEREFKRVRGLKTENWTK